MRHIAGNVFQQDSAPAHRARETVQLLQQETPQFISPDQWPPNSPDLNPVDHRIWGWMQERVYKTPVRDIDDLKQRLIDTWATTKKVIKFLRNKVHPRENSAYAYVLEFLAMKQSTRTMDAPSVLDLIN